jgi:dihydrolipoamide dehydrogenase
MIKKYDVAVIGAGPGGYVAAIRAAQLGMKTAVIEKDTLGGVCLNWGCIPTKALLRASEIHHLLHNVGDYGFSVDNIKFDMKKVVERSRGVAKQLSSGIAHLLKKNKVETLKGHARLKGNRQIDVNGETIEAKHIILATGARPRILPGLEPDGKFVWTSKEAMIADDIPEKLLVIGSGAIGVEFASFYQNMGSKVTIVEMQDRILPVEDAEISDFAKKSFEKQGMKIHTETTVKKLDKSDKSVTATLDQKGKTSQESFDRVIVAIGIQGNTEDLGLEKTKAKVDRNQIQVNSWYETEEPGLYAIGDVISGPWLAHKASHEGVICVEKIAGQKDIHAMNKLNIPGCTYSRPQIASIGLTEAKAKEQGFAIKVGRFPFQGNGKAIALGEPEGIVKTIFDAKTGELLGAHMIGAEVTEMIQGFGIAKTLETTEAELMQTIFPHPTLSEMMHESVLDAFNRVIHF